MSGVLGKEYFEQLAREHFIPFCHYQSPWFKRSKHHHLIAEKLEAVERGNIRKLIICAPPRHGKSTMVSQHFPAWYMGRNPNNKVIFTTYGQSLSSDFGTMVRDQIQQESFQQLFSGLEMSKDTKAKHKFNLLHNGQRTRGAYIAVGRSGSITGKGGNLIIIDDLIKDYAEAMSETVRKSCVNFWDNTLSTRMEEVDSAVIAMATRWHQDDLIGHLLRNETGWELLNLPAINEEGEALWPERFNIEFLIEQKERMKSGFYAQYMGQPAPETGHIIKEEYFGEYMNPPRLGKFFQTWDLTFKEKGSSFVVGAVWQFVGQKLYLRDIHRGQWGFTQTKNVMLKVKNMWPQAELTYVEDKANGPAIYDNLKREHGGLVMWKTGTDGKKERLYAVEQHLILGKLILPEYAPWLNDYKNELLIFDRGSYDDQVDVTTMALDICFNKMNNNVILKGKKRSINKFL